MFELATNTDYVDVNGSQQDALLLHPTTTQNVTWPSIPYPFTASIIIGMVLSVITVACILGNTLVILTVIIVRRLRTPANYLIVSLAVSDLLVGLVVMPLSVVYELTGRWPIGKLLCSLWVSSDVMLCTASISNLLMIAIDRYRVIQYSLTYSQNRNWKHAVGYTAVAWIISITTGVVIPLIAGWSAQYDGTHCIINQDINYQIYATVVAFYAPLIGMIGLYGKIFIISIRLAAKEPSYRPAAIETEHQEMLTPSASIPDSAAGKLHSDSCHTQFIKLDNNNSMDSHLDWRPHLFNQSSSNTNGTHHGEEANKYPSASGLDSNGFCLNNMLMAEFSGPVKGFSEDVPVVKKVRRKSVANSQATKTLGIVMGLFIACWLPFFIVAVIRSVCYYSGSCAFSIPARLTSILTWLGYANSCFNPLIYARYTREFKTPFREMICCRWRNINEAVRQKQYKFEYGM